MEKKETKINGKDKLMHAKKRRGGKRKRTKKKKKKKLMTMRVPKINEIEQKITKKVSKKERKSKGYRKRIF